MKNLLQIFTLSACVLGTAIAADAPAANQPTADEASKGLQAALGSLVDQSLATASDSKTADAQLTVGLPGKLDKLETTLRAAGQGQLVDDFKAKLKSVAVQSVPLTKDAFKSATSDVKIDDPLTVLKTAPDGLTSYTKTHTRPTFISKVQPLVASKSKEAGVAASYQAMVAKAGPFASAVFGKQPPAEVDQYVTEQTVDFVYGQMGKGEGALRANPSLSNNALVKKVFSAVQK